MDEVLKTITGEMARQAPSLTVLCFIVYFFLRAQKEQYALLRDLHEEHLVARGESREAIRENTHSNREVTRAMHELAARAGRFDVPIFPAREHFEPTPTHNPKHDEP